ncbi:unnamed protein product [Lupinus luteus]|uniref:Uncharacterized protein n=1 Tax=Lupinus luteus TaxID=3873 RepID=A0AAV1WBR8_LUPLU
MLQLRHMNLVWLLIYLDQRILSNMQRDACTARDTAATVKMFESYSLLSAMFNYVLLFVNHFLVFGLYKALPYELNSSTCSKVEFVMLLILSKLCTQLQFMLKDS